MSGAPDAYLLRGRRVPKSRYLAPEMLDWELDRVFPKTWLFAGPATDLPTVGSYLTLELGAESIVVVRGPSGVGAFHNVCRHRGRALVEPGHGQLRSLRCAYHHWEYGLDGSLVAVPEADSFAECGDGPTRLGQRGSLPIAPGASTLGLHPVACETRHGLVWIHLDPDPTPLSDYLGPVDGRLARYHLDSYVLEEDSTLDLDCNWKIGVDAFNEALHLRAVHPELLGAVDDSSTTLELLGEHSAIRVPFGRPSPRAPRSDGPSEVLVHWMRGMGLDPRLHDPTHARAAVRAHLRASTDPSFADLDDDELTDNVQFYVFPNLTLNVYATRLMLLRHRPHPTDPGRMLLDQQQYARASRARATAPRPKHRAGRWGAGGSLGHVTDQDAATLVRVQRGMRSRGLSSIVLGALEERLLHMHRTLDRYLFGERAR